MRTVVCIEVEHDKPIPALANLIAGRAWTIGGVTAAEVMVPETYSATQGAEVNRLQRQGFTMSEIALGLTEVVRG